MDAGSFLGITDGMVLAFGIPLVLAMVAIEVLVSNLRNENHYNRPDTLGTIGLLAGNAVVSFLVKSLTLAVFVFAYQYRIFSFSETMPAWLLLIVALLLIDFVFYVFHRASHRVRFLWAVHLSHHSSEEFNFSVAFRQAWLGPIIKIPFFATLSLLGLDPTVLVVMGSISTLYGVWVHTKIIPKLGILEWLICTPSSHRVHHGANPQYIDKNYANMFIFIDRFLGTFEPEIEPVRYGLKVNVNTNNPFHITLFEFRRMWADIKTARTAWEALGYFFGPPDWKPKYKRCDTETAADKTRS